MAIFASLCLAGHRVGGEAPEVIDDQAVAAPTRPGKDTSTVARDGYVAAVPAEARAETAPEEQVLKDRCHALRNDVAALSILLGELSASKQPGKLQELERKAFEYAVLSTQVATKDRTIAQLRAELADARSRVAALEKSCAGLRSATNRLAAALEQSEERQVSLKRALSLVKLGRFEYYEVRKGDTCESIAGQDMVYGERAKHVLIRQANAGNIEDLDNLSEGEVIIIPRIPASVSYEF